SAPLSARQVSALLVECRGQSVRRAGDASPREAGSAGKGGRIVMKPIEYLCLAILLAVINLLERAAGLTLVMWALVIMWVWGSIRAFAVEQRAKREAARQ